MSVSVCQSASQCHSCAHAEHGKQYEYQPLRNGTVPQEQGLWSPCIFARLVFGCHTSMIQLPSLLLNASVLPCGTRNLTNSLICVGTKQLVSWMYSIVHHSKSLYRTLLAVDIIFSLLTFLINTSRYTSNTTSTSLLCEASYSKLPHGT